MSELIVIRYFSKSAKSSKMFIEKWYRNKCRLTVQREKIDFGIGMRCIYVRTEAARSILYYGYVQKAHTYTRV